MVATVVCKLGHYTNALAYVYAFVRKVGRIYTRVHRRPSGTCVHRCLNVRMLFLLHIVMRFYTLCLLPNYELYEVLQQIRVWILVVFGTY